MARDLAELESRAYHLAEEYRDGHLAHLAGKAWPDTWRRLIEELRARCPGFSSGQYDAALEAGFRDSG
jgi:hypothetical protein